MTRAEETWILRNRLHKAIAQCAPELAAALDRLECCDDNLDIDDAALARANAQEVLRRRSGEMPLDVYGEAGACGALDNFEMVYDEDDLRVIAEIIRERA